MPRPSPFTYILGHLIPRPVRPTFFDWYAYLRWVDDTVDQAPPGAVWVASFLDRQFMLLAGTLPTGDGCFTMQENMLRWLIRQDVPGGGLVLAGLLRDMLECIEFDAMRRARLAPYDVLRTHWRKEARSYLASIAWFCGLAESEDPPGLTAGVGAKIAHVLRDLEEGCRAGRINVSSEEIAAFDLRPSRLAEGPADPAAMCWVAANACLARSLLERGLNDIRACPSLRYKLIAILLVTKYQCYVHDLLRIGAIAKLPLRTRAFLKQMTLNLAMVFVPWCTPQHRTKRFPHIVRPAPLALLGLLTAMTIGASRAERKDLQRSLARAIERAADQGRMQRRFRVACLLGRTAFQAIAPEAAAAAPCLKRAAGLVYGYWAICAIELDRLMDGGTLNPLQARFVVNDWLKRLHVALFDRAAVTETWATFGAGEIFDSLTAGFMRTLLNYDALCRMKDLSGLEREARSTFYAGTASLMEGQLQSLLQMEPTSRRDWPWYCAEILNSKNVQFLLAPFHLWRVERGSEERLERFERQFERLSRAYLHYQLIDDVSDIKEDTSQGIIGAPGAILLSQGSLARTYLTLTTRARTVGAELAAADAAALVEGVRRSCLLAADLAEAPLFDLYRHRFGEPHSCAQRSAHAESSFRCALSNREPDFALMLEELASRRFQQAQAFLEALRSRDARSAQSWLLDSRAPDRLLNAVGHEAAVIDLRGHLDTDRSCAENKLLYILERLMRHTHQAARDVVSSERARDL